MKKKFKDIIVITVLAMIGFAFFNKILLFQHALYGGDFLLYFYPVKKFIRDQVLINATLPFWNMYQLSGTPLIANIQASMFYPMGFLYYVLAPEKAYVYSTILHCAMGCLFMYGFMRAISVQPLGAFVAAMVFAFNGFFMGHLYAGHLSFVQNYVWIPLIFLFVLRFTETWQFSYAVGGGFVLGVQILGGFPQVAFYTILACLAFVLFHILIALKSRKYAMVSRAGIGLILVLLLGFAIAAVQVLPTAEFARFSTRAGGVSYAMATYDSLHPKELLAFLIPDVFGNAVDRTYWRSAEIWHFWETCGYLGVLPLFLVLVRVESQHLHRLRIFFCLTAGFSLLLALGKFNPIYPLIYHLPGFNSFRIPAQILFLYVFSIAALAGIGMDRLRQGAWRFSRGGISLLVIMGGILILFTIGLRCFPFQFFFELFMNFGQGTVTHANLPNLYERIGLSVEKSFFLFLLCFLLLILLKRRKISWRVFGLLTSAILIFDLFSFGRQFIQPYEFSSSKKREQLLAYMPDNPTQGRVITGREVFLANDGLKDHFPSIQGYDPLLLKRYVQFFQASQGYPPDDHVVNLENVRDPEAKLLKLLHVQKAFLNEGIREMNNAIPYAQVVAAWTIKPFEEILPFMKGAEFDPLEAVIFEPSAMQEVKPGKGLKPLVSSCSVADYQSENIKLKVSTNQPGYLVLSEIFYPGWQAVVDGKDVDILCGNYLFRVVPLEEGHHHVCLKFISWPFRIGAIISLISFLFCLGTFFYRKRGRQALRY
jgi:Bacterial membrane protein YfhO